MRCSIVKLKPRFRRVWHIGLRHYSDLRLVLWMCPQYFRTHVSNFHFYEIEWKMSSIDYLLSKQYLSMRNDKCLVIRGRNLFLVTSKTRHPIGFPVVGREQYHCSKQCVWMRSNRAFIIHRQNTKVTFWFI